MNTPKISTPQALPSVFEEARSEENWLIFAIGEADDKGKRPKRPVARDRPYIWTNRDKAASFTFDKAVERLAWFRDNYDLDDINAKAAQRRADMVKEGKKPGPEIVVERYVLGYFAREESALVALDFDNVAEDGVVLDFELAGMLEETGAYAEFSSSGTGVRVFMPRVWGDSSLHAGEKNDVGLFVSDRGAACAITWNTISDGAERDDALLDLVVERHGSVRDSAERDTADVEDQVLEHGRIEVDTFLSMIELVKNDERFDEFNEWLGMVRGPREYYEIVDPDRLDEVREAVEEWCKTWEGGTHDADKFEDVWSRKPRKGGRAGLGSWVRYAQEAGWTWQIDVEPEEVDEWAFLKELDTEKVGAGSKKITRAIANYMNTVKVVRHMPALKGLIGKNVLTGGLVRLREWDGVPREYPAEWTDTDMHKVMQTIQGARKNGTPVFSHFHIDQIKQAIEGGAELVQPISDMIDRLPKWDGRERLDTWLTDYFGVEDRQLARAYARKFMIGLIARGKAKPDRPVKLDTVLVLSGNQGMNKSTFFETLAGYNDLFADHVGDITKKEGSENILGRWICEFAEGEVVTKADRRALKGFLARTSDKYRPAYGRNVQSFARGCVFVMPTNDEAVLNDPTGSRRYWPVTATQTAPLGRLRAERRQLLAEAKAAYDAGEIWFLTPDEEKFRTAEESDYEIEDVFEEPLAAILKDVIEGQIVSLTELLTPLGFELTKGGNGQTERRVRDVLRKWGWERAKSGPKRGYRRGTPENTFPPVSEEAEKARKEGQVLPLPVTSEFSKIE